MIYSECDAFGGPLGSGFRTKGHYAAMNVTLIWKDAAYYSVSKRENINKNVTDKYNDTSKLHVERYSV